jgi:hypothetical protein
VQNYIRNEIFDFHHVFKYRKSTSTSSTAFHPNFPHLSGGPLPPQSCSTFPFSIKHFSFHHARPGQPIHNTLLVDVNFSIHLFPIYNGSITSRRQVLFYFHLKASLNLYPNSSESEAWPNNNEVC